ncbi:hypothetical protein KAX02_01495 [candidate division WOR-3 bacterium]|nr:hypothetical protein [candidate division WOR-3 bacterium]
MGHTLDEINNMQVWEYIELTYSIGELRNEKRGNTSGKTFHSGKMKPMYKKLIQNKKKLNKV